MVLSVILLLLGVVCVVYFFVYAFLVDLNNVFTYFWLLLGIVGIGGGIVLRVMHRYGRTFPRWLSRGAGVLAGVLLLLFLTVEGIIIGYGRARPDPGADYVIVLGARVRGETVTANLARRLEAAYGYLKENPRTQVILSGGKGPGEEISEAEAMKRYLEKKGIAPERMLLEDQSENTDENLSFSMEKMGNPAASTVIVSNDFHIFRALRLAKKKGIQEVQGLGASTKWYTAPNMYVREAFAVVKYAVFRQI